jgi:hypothetical protein
VVNSIFFKHPISRLHNSIMERTLLSVRHTLADCSNKQMKPSPRSEIASGQDLT